MGHVGFLAEAEVRDVDAVIERAVSGDYTVEERTVLDVQVIVEAEERYIRTWAVNEAAIEKVDSGRMIEVMLEIDDRPISSFGTDAVILATPTGSTAYSFSAGGPIVWPEADVMLMVPLGAHALFTRPLVVGPRLAHDGAHRRPQCRRSNAVVRLAAHVRAAAGGRGARDSRHAAAAVRARLSHAPFADRLVAKFDLPVEGWRSRRA